MNFDHRNPRLRRGFAFVALAAVLGLAAVGLTQCRNVSDSVTGVDLSPASGLHAKNSCVRQCNEKYKACKRAEEARHKAAKKACKSDKACRKAENGSGSGDGGGGSASDQCRKEENLLHKIKLLECFKAFKDCKANCYNEGSGNGGQ
jgi:hypothetical protein